MSLSIRDLMRREKASRQRVAAVDEPHQRKVQVVCEKEESDTDAGASCVARPVEPVVTPMNMTPRVLEETFELLSDAEDITIVESSHKRGYNRKEWDIKHESGFFDKIDTAVSKSRRLNQKTEGFKHRSSYTTKKTSSGGNRGASDSDDIDSGHMHGPSFNGLAGETTSSFDDDEYTDDLKTSSEHETVRISRFIADSTIGHSNIPGSHISADVDSQEMFDDIPGSHIDDDVRIYDQLNTAFCSRIDYERQQILRNLDGSEMLPEPDAHPAAGKGTITSANFGKSNIRVSKEENLPEGFFDNRKVDAQARGKLTSKEADEKIQMLNKSKAEVLSEAKYLQDKIVESYHERIRLEHDAQEHEEKVRELTNTVEVIKSDLAVDVVPIEVVVEKKPEIVEHVDTVLDDIYAYEDYEDMSWRMKSIM